MLRDCSAAKPLLVYNHWRLLSTAIQGQLTNSHADLIGLVEGASWQADWLELPEQCPDAGPEIAPSVPQSPAVSKVLQWHSHLADAVDTAMPHRQQARMGVGQPVCRWALTDATAMPCSCVVAEDQNSSVTDTDGARRPEQFYAAVSTERVPALELHRVMAGCCTRTLLDLAQADCTARALCLPTSDTSDVSGKQDAEMVSVSVKVWNMHCLCDFL